MFAKDQGSYDILNYVRNEEPGRQDCISSGELSVLESNVFTGTVCSEYPEKLNFPDKPSPMTLSKSTLASFLERNSRYDSKGIYYSDF